MKRVGWERNLYYKGSISPYSPLEGVLRIWLQISLASQNLPWPFIPTLSTSFPITFIGINSKFNYPKFKLSVS